MKQITSILILFLLIMIITEHPVFSQENGSVYLKVDYMSVPPGNQAEYLDVELELWGPVHEERLQRGIILSWSLYSVVAGEPDKTYDYIAVNVFTDFEKIDYWQLGEIIEQVYPDSDPGELYRRTDAARKVVRTEIWKLDRVINPAERQDHPGVYALIHFSDDRAGSENLQELELDFWKPIHRARIDNNVLESWAAYTLLYPGGDVRQYTHSTVEFHENLGDLRAPVGLGLAGSAHPDLTDDQIRELFNRSESSRSVYKTELWKRIGELPHPGNEK